MTFPRRIDERRDLATKGAGGIAEVQDIEVISLVCFDSGGNRPSFRETLCE